MLREQNFPNEFGRSNNDSNRRIAVDELVQDVIDSYESDFRKRNIVIRTELSSVTAAVDLLLIRTAFVALINHSVQLLKNGGELSITLIDGQHHWELEVANQTVRFPTSQEELDLMFSEKVQAMDIPSVLPFPASNHLRSAYRAALSHGGQLQMWDCPQGGTAYVLVIPKRTNQIPHCNNTDNNHC